MNKDKEQLCPKCQSDKVIPILYLNKYEFELDIEIKKEQVVINGWKRNYLPENSCLDCHAKF